MAGEYTDPTDDPDDAFHREPAEVARDMLLASETRAGGRPGIGTPMGIAYAQGRGWISENGYLTRKGVAKAREIQREEGWIFGGGVDIPGRPPED